MGIRLRCGKCGLSLETRDRFAGKRVSCPDCGALIEVPGQLVAPSETPAPKPPPAPAATAAPERVATAAVAQASDAAETPATSDMRRSRLPVAESTDLVWKWVAIGGAAVLLPSLLAMATAIGYLLGRQSALVAPAQQVALAPVERDKTSLDGRLATEQEQNTEIPELDEAAAGRRPETPEAASISDAAGKSRSVDGAPAASGPRPQLIESPPAEAARPEPDAPAIAAEAFDEPAAPRSGRWPLPPVNNEPRVNAPIEAFPEAAMPDEEIADEKAPAGEFVDAEMADEERAAELPDDVAFRPLDVDEPASTFAMSEDGALLFLANESSGRVTVWDIAAGRTVATLETPSPRCLLSRDANLFVGNHGEGTISVFNAAGGWGRKRELMLPRRGVVYLSAAGKRKFKNQLLVTAHGDGPQASYQDCHVYLVNVARDGRRNSAVRRWPQ